jgi:hypothetical protein
LKTLLCAAVLAAATAHGSPVRADDSSDPYDGKLNFGFTPYVWLPSINASLTYKLSDIHGYVLPDGGIDRSFTAKINPNSYLSNLNFALMGTGYVRKGNFALYTDFMNVNAGKQASQIFDLHDPVTGATVPFDGNAQVRAVSTLWTVGPSYTIVRRGGSSLNVLLGGRFAWLTTSADYQLNVPNTVLTKNGSLAKNTAVDDAILGTFGQYALGKRWSIPYYVDLGTGDPSFTWQALLGVKYGQASLSWRHLSYSGGANLLQGMQLSGPLFGYSFTF